MTIGFWGQLRLCLWKHLLLKRRAPISTLLQVGICIIVIIVIIIIIVIIAIIVIIVFLLDISCLFIILIKCLKGHKSLRVLYNSVFQEYLVGR